MWSTGPFENAILLQRCLALAVLPPHLADHEYHVLTCEDGAEALRQSRAYKDDIHLLLSDFQMPAMSGVELAPALTAEGPRLKVLLTSGFAAGVFTLKEEWHFHRNLSSPHNCALWLRGWVRQTNLRSFRHRCGHCPIRKLVTAPHIPTAFRTQMPTAITTTMFSIDFMLEAIGMKRLISHSATPTTTNTTTRFINGIFLSSLSILSVPAFT
jgi:response regulator RpfG family c-di-GMP phosphodiesterase